MKGKSIILAICPGNVFTLPPTIPPLLCGVWALIVTLPVYWNVFEVTSVLLPTPSPHQQQGLRLKEVLMVLREKEKGWKMGNPPYSVTNVNCMEPLIHVDLQLLVYNV